MIAVSLLIGMVLYGIFAWFAVRWVGRVGTFCAFTVTTKKTLQMFCAAVFILVPTWDVIPGWLYFTHLCDYQAEVRILKTISLEETYFLPNGLADGQKIGHLVKTTFLSDKRFAPLFNIEKFESSIARSGTGELLGTAKEFIYHGNWITRLILPESIYSCSKYQPFGAHMALWREVIRHQGQG